MSDDKYDRKSSMLAEFYIEFLGSLVPGLFALILSFIVLGLSFVVMCRSLQHGGPIPAFPKNINFGLGAYGVTGILLVASYVLGSIFYRQDPKIPDWRSARRIYRNASEIERKRLAVQPNPAVQKKHHIIYQYEIQQSDAQFPYFFLYEYLRGRGLYHLAEWVPWQGNNPDTWIYRTKMFINQIKIRLQFLVPARCKDIVRNEAHVRLATSVWYATIWIRAICILAFFMLASALVSVPSTGFDHVLSGALCAAVLTFGFVLFLKHQIENFIHYLRVREIVYVLETAYFATLNGVELHREDFDPRQRK